MVAPTPVPLDWASLLATARRAVTSTARALGRLRRLWLQEVAGACRLEGWNQLRTVGYRERAWDLKKRTGPKRLRRLVLTFDDGPMTKKTPRILDVLKRRKQKATFFVVGRVIHAGSYRLVRRILAEGHTLANHSYHHLVQMHSRDQAAELIEAEFELTQAMVDLALLARSWRDFRKLRIRLLGGDKKGSFARELPGAWPAMRARWQAILRERTTAGVSPHRMVYARPPGGAPFSTRWRRHHRQTYALALRRLGLINIMWDEDSGDSDRMLTESERRDTKRLTEAILEGTRRGGVFLMHDRIGLAGLDAALVAIRARKGLAVIPLPEAAQAWYGCAPRTLSWVLQVLQAFDYRAPEPARPRARPQGQARRVRKRRVRKRRVRKRRVRKRRARRPAPRRRVRPRKRAQGLTPRRR